MSRKKRELPDWDDGRTIADMNVEGMPWSGPKGLRGPGFSRDAEGRRGAGGESLREQEGLRQRDEAGKRLSRPQETMTREESRYYTWGALKAALAVIGVMCAGLVVFILFCQFVWFR